ncbi:MAG TPA: trypsin-like peptidase domain-containing protein, partial [Thermoanaerobaculia bacterium]|nr:trypsin-like peptidase domain-containing protein [Thermoanaerobaculia bacterium]
FLARAQAAAEVNPPLVLPESLAAPARVAAPPLRLAEGMSAQPLMAVRSAETAAGDQLEALTAWNRAGNRPVRIGFARPLPSSQKVVLTAAAKGLARPTPYAGGFVSESLAGRVVWGTSLRVEGAYRLRVHLTDVAVPAGTRFWVYGLGEEPRAFGLELLGPDGGIWTPSVGGGEVYLEAELPAGAPADGQTARFTVREVSESFRLDAEGSPVLTPDPAPIGECIVDATCVSTATLDVVDAYRRAVASLVFVDGGQEFVCSGALLNDTDQATLIPYLLTANHCFDTQAAASTLEAFWDYRSTTCNGVAPNLFGLQRSNGSTLLATGAGSDFTFVRLNSIPSNRVFLGWDDRAPANNTRLYRISHPFGEPQSYSTGLVKTSGVPVCADSPRPRFLYSQVTQGGTFGGSSGSPVILAGGFTVGQLNGGCGPSADDGCDYDNSEIDGAFIQTYPAIRQWLSPPVTNPGVCTPNATTLCLSGGRFQVRTQWQTAQGASGDGMAVSLTSDTGYFWFFNSSNVEMVIKVLNACSLNSRFWVFSGGLTDVRVVTTVTDVQTGNVKTYTNPLSTKFQPVQDTNAFGACP